MADGKPMCHRFNIGLLRTNVHELVSTRVYSSNETARYEKNCQLYQRTTVLFDCCLESQAIDFFCNGLVVGLRTVVFHTRLLLFQGDLERTVVDIKATIVALQTISYRHRFNPIHLAHVTFDILHTRLTRHAIDVEDRLRSRTHLS